MLARLSWKRLKNASVLFALVFGLAALLAAGQTVLKARTQALQDAALEEAVTVRAKGAALAFAKALGEDWNRTKWTAARIAGGSEIERQVAIDSLVSTPGRISWAGFADASGTIRTATGGLLVGRDASQRPWFQNGLNGPFAGDAHEAVMLADLLGNDSDEPLRFLDFAMPVTGADGTVLGVLGVHIDVRWARSYLADISASLGIDLLLVDGSGLVSISGFEPQALWKPLRIDDLSAEEGRFVGWTDGASYFTALVPDLGVDDMPSFGWRLVARIRPDALSTLTTPANGIVGGLQDSSTTTSLQAVFGILASVALLLGVAAFLFNTRANRSSAEAERTMQKLLTSEQRFRTLFGTASLPIAIVRGQTYQAVNEAAARLLGYASASELEGKTFLDISPELQADGTRSVDRIAAIEAELARGTARFDWLHLRSDGSTILLDILLTVVQSDAGRDVFAVWTDVTAIRKAEETVRDYQKMLERAVTDRPEELEATHSALRAAKDQSDQLAKLRSDFLATMSHEIRGPLNSLIGFVELAAEGHLNKQQASFMKKAVQAGRHLASIVDDVLDLTRAEAGRLTLESVDFDLVDFAHSTLEGIEPMLRNKPVELVLEADPDLPDSISADPLRLRQVLMNYLTNAAKFTERGEIRLQLHRVWQDGREFLRFAVEDTGIGLRPEQKERLFQSFSQADISTARLYGGSGLGLAICQQLAVLMDGRVGFDSTAGRGSRFWFDLPCEGHLCGTPAAPPLATGAGLTVWLGIANPHVRANLEAWLKRHGFEVEPVGPEPPQSPRVRVIHDAAAAASVPWLSAAGQPNRFLLTADQTAAGRSSRTIKTPVHPRNVIDLLAPAGKSTPQVTDKPEMIRYPAHLKVLVADDDELNRDLAKARLARFGLTVRTATNGTEALQAVLEDRFDLILMDHQMPVINGIEATRRIRALPPPRGQTPIIGISGSDRAEVRASGEAAGMNGFLLKPLSNANLGEILARYLAP